MKPIKKYMAIILLALIAILNVIQFHHHDCNGSAHINFMLDDASAFVDDTSDGHNHNCCHCHSHQCDDSSCSLRIYLSTDLINGSPTPRIVCLNYDAFFSGFGYLFTERYLFQSHKTGSNYEIPSGQLYSGCPNRYRGSPFFA